jgi:hypothetical protein
MDQPVVVDLSGLEARMNTLVPAFEGAGFTDVETLLPKDEKAEMRISGTWQGQTFEHSVLIDGAQYMVDHFFGNAERMLRSLKCKSQHSRQTWGSLGLETNSEALAPCAEIDCSQGIGPREVMPAAGEMFRRSGPPGSMQWVSSAEKPLPKPLDESV